MRRAFIRTLILALAAALLLSGAAPALAEKKVIRETNALSIFRKWFYVPSTVPGDFSICKASQWADYYYEDGYYIPIAWDVTLLSGDEWLADAVSLRKEETWDGSENVSIDVDNEKLTKPGRAKILIRREFSSFIVENVEDVCVLSWEEDPLME